MVVAVAHAGLVRRRHHPVGIEIPQFHLGLDAAAYRVTGHHAAQHAVRRRQVLPVLFGQLIDGFQEHGALLHQHGAWLGRGIQGPLQTCVADVDGQEAHGKSRGGAMAEPAG